VNRYFPGVRFVVRASRSRAPSLLLCALLGALALAYAVRGEPARRSGNLVLLPVRDAPHGAVVRMVTHRRVVALSFDDGPDPRYTPVALRALRRAGDHATFFALGASALAHRGLIAAELRAGHEVANHTFDHPHLRLLGPRAIAAEIDHGRSALIAAGAPEPRLFRAPFGEFDWRAARHAARRHELMVAWSLTVERALNGHSIRHAVAWLMHRVRPGVIILAHDGRLNRERTMQALPLLLAELRHRGYRVVTVSELLRIGGTFSRARLRALGLR
jgi:peptidoglycan/xylan/chitin deacetylase (PgdA/CDA1 family)